MTNLIAQKEEKNAGDSNSNLKLTFKQTHRQNLQQKNTVYICIRVVVFVQFRSKVLVEEEACEDDRACDGYDYQWPPKDVVSCYVIFQAEDGQDQEDCFANVADVESCEGFAGGIGEVSSGDGEKEEPNGLPPGDSQRQHEGENSESVNPEGRILGEVQSDFRENKHIIEEKISRLSLEQASGIAVAPNTAAGNDQRDQNSRMSEEGFPSTIVPHLLLETSLLQFLQPPQNPKSQPLSPHQIDDQAPGGGVLQEACAENFCHSCTHGDQKQHHADGSVIPPGFREEGAAETAIALGVGGVVLGGEGGKL